MGSIREVAISRSASSRTMSAADRRRIWRSASKNTYRHHGEVRSGGRPGGGIAVRHCARDRSSGRKDVRHCGRYRSSRKHRNGPQSRATTPTHLLGGEDAARAQEKEAGADSDTKRHAPVETNHTARPAVKHGFLIGGEVGQCKVDRCGPQSRQRLRVRI